MDSCYKGLIWTNHALTRMRERDMKQFDVYVVWRNPDKSRYAKTKSAWIYKKNINGKIIEVVAKKNEKGEWVILSVWLKKDIVKIISRKKDLLSCIRNFFRYNKNS